jgi:hypothetical protein
MTGNPGGRVKDFQSLEPKENRYIRDMTSVKPITAIPVRAVETAIAIMDLTFIPFLLLKKNSND